MRPMSEAVPEVADLGDTARREPAWVRAVTAWSRFVGVVGGVACLLLVVQIVIDVAGRYALSRPLPGTIEITEFWLMPMLALLPLAMGQLTGEHIRVTLLTDRLRGGLRKSLDAAALCVAITIVGMFAYTGWQVALTKMAVRETGVTSLWLPVWPMRFVVVLALVTLLLQLVVSLVQTLTTSPDHPGDGSDATAPTSSDEVN